MTMPFKTIRARAEKRKGGAKALNELLLPDPLRRADAAIASVAEIARTHQFRQPGRFAVSYRTVFGEMPSSTLRRSLIKTT